MESQDSPFIIPCSEEMPVEETTNASEAVLPPNSSSLEQNSEDLHLSQSLLANCNDVTLGQEDGDISSINISAVNNIKVKSSNSHQRNSVSNSTMDLESSEMNPMSSTRIEQDNSMSLLNEGFMIDSASLSLSAVNENSRLDHKNASIENCETVNDTEESESTEMEMERDPEVMEDEIEESSSASPSTKGAVQSDEDGDEEDSSDYPLPQFPLGRVKKIMSICAAADDDEAIQDGDNSKGKKEKGKGNIMISKEAIYLTTLATEHFISVIGKMAGNVTVSSKKKTLTLEHLKRAVSDTDAFAFLEGCFQPSLIIGD